MITNVATSQNWKKHTHPLKFQAPILLNIIVFYIKKDNKNRRFSNSEVFWEETSAVVWFWKHFLKRETGTSESPILKYFKRKNLFSDSEIISRRKNWTGGSQILKFVFQKKKRNRRFSDSENIFVRKKKLNRRFSDSEKYFFQKKKRNRRFYDSENMFF